MLWHLNPSFRDRRTMPAVTDQEIGAEESGLPGLQWRQSYLIVWTGLIAQPPLLPETAASG